MRKALELKVEGLNNKRLSELKPQCTSELLTEACVTVFEVSSQMQAAEVSSQMLPEVWSCWIFMSHVMELLHLHVSHLIHIRSEYMSTSPNSEYMSTSLY